MAADCKFAGAVPGRPESGAEMPPWEPQRGPVRAPTSHYALRELLYYTVRELVLTVYS
jgi:hypothetical protein